jgi:hypothetical protein
MKFIMTSSGRIMLRADYEREQATAVDRSCYEQREKLNREWRIARAAAAGNGPGEQCGTPGCVNDARWIPIREGNAGSRVYRCTQCCDDTSGFRTGI